MKNATAAKLIWETQKLLRANMGKYFFPVQVARELEISRVEAELALRMCVEYGRVFRRSDGRYLLRDERSRRPRPAGEAWHEWIQTDDAKGCANAATLGQNATPYLENRLWRAFVAGHAAGAQR